MRKYGGARRAARPTNAARIHGSRGRSCHNDSRARRNLAPPIRSLFLDLAEDDEPGGGVFGVAADDEELPFGERLLDGIGEDTFAEEAKLDLLILEIGHRDDAVAAHGDGFFLVQLQGDLLAMHFKIV